MKEREIGYDNPQTELARLWDGLRELSDRLVDVIPLSAPSAPILVTGDWGSGKSSLLAVTGKRLRASGHLTIWFNAWKYEGEGPLLPLLLRALWQHAPWDLTRQREARRRWKNLSRSAGQMVKQKGLPVAVLAGALGIPAFPFPGADLFHFLHMLEPLTHPSGHGDHQDGTDAVAVVQREFRWLVWELAARHHERPVIFFIDDLDRCNPVAALSLIESLRVLVGDSGSKFMTAPARYVVALDRTALVRAVTQKFSGMGNYDGNRYLEKIFPISFHLPQPEGAAILQFVQSFLAHGGVPEEDDGRGDILSLALAEPIFANPRLMNRCIERFSLVLDFEKKTNRQDAAATADQRDYNNLFLAKWIAAGERWPDLRRLFSRHGDDYWLKVGDYFASQKASLPDREAAELFAEQDLLLWLRRELFGTKDTRLVAYREADRRLRNFGL